MAVGLVAAAVWAAPAAATEYQFDRKWAVDKPLAVAVGPQGDVYVADGDDTLHRFTATGTLMSSWGGAGDEPGRFDGAEGLAVDAQGDVYVADYGNNRVQKFSGAGALITTWPTPGAANGVAIGPQGDVFVVDTSNDQVLRYGPGGASLGAWGASGSADGQLAVPWGIAVDPAGDVYVSERDNDRVQKFTAGGALLGRLGQRGRDRGQFSAPDGVAIGPQGNVYVADSGNDRVQELTPAGAFVGQFGERGWGAGELDEPRDVAFDAQGNVYVASHYFLDDAIVKYAPRGGRRAKQVRLGMTRSGRRVTLTAQVAPCGAARASRGERVVFERRTRKGWRRAGRGRASGPRCEAVLRLTLRSTTRFRARSPRSAAFDGARSKSLRVRAS